MVILQGDGNSCTTDRVFLAMMCPSWGNIFREPKRWIGGFEEEKKKEMDGDIAKL